MKSPLIAKLRNQWEREGVITKLPVCPKCGKQVSPKGWDSHAKDCDPPDEAA